MSAEANPPPPEMTGERFVPETMGSGQIASEHHARYAFVAPLAAGRHVLDAGCGEGYGTAVLARAGAASAVGVDVSENAVARARATAGTAASFHRQDLHELAFEDDSFDVAVCFEAIEHVVDRDRVLDELRRVLAANGVLAISTPNRGVYLRGNPYHLYEYTSAELVEALQRRFANVRLYGQQSYTATLIAAPEVLATESLERPVARDVRKAVGAEAGQELYAIALASDGPLADLQPLAALGSTSQIHVFQQFAVDFEERARTAEAHADAYHAELSGTAFSRDAALLRMAAAEAALVGATDVYERSTTWRMTRPLRTAGRWARGLLRHR